MATKYLVHVEAPKPYKKLISHFLNEYSSSFSSINPNYSHLTLFVMNSDQKNEEKIITSIEDAVKEPFYQNLSGVFLSTLDNFGSKFDENVSVSRFEQTGPIKLLHLELANNLRKYITKPLGKLPEEFKNDEDRFYAFESTGSHFFGKFYTPHTTLGTLKPNKIAELELDSLEGLGWKINEIILSKKVEKEWQKVKSFSLT